MKTNYTDIIKGMRYFRYKRDILTVFQDCMKILALRIAIVIDPYRNVERRKELDATLKQYEDQDKPQLELLLEKFTGMLKMSIDNFDDHLGNIYMQLVPKSANKMGVAFTPYYLSRVMAELTLNFDQFNTKDVIGINDPCCGGGALLVAACDALNDRKINYARRVIINANDIQITCVYMTFLQLSFIGASAIVEHKNTITQEKWDEFRTAGYLLIHAKGGAL